MVSTYPVIPSGPHKFYLYQAAPNGIHLQRYK